MPNSIISALGISCRASSSRSPAAFLSSYIQWTITVPGAVIVSFEGNLHFNKLGTPFGTFDHAISAYGTIGTEDVKYGLSKGKWEVEFTGIATAANGDMYSVVDGATLAFSVTK